MTVNVILIAVNGSDILIILHAETFQTVTGATKDHIREGVFVTLPGEKKVVNSILATLVLHCGHVHF
nr:hypothetical protein [Nissabacter archeti]